MTNIKLTIAYDGVAFSGWQVQPNGPSVQGAIEEVLERITGSEIPVIGAGRTDAGVHALGQVVNFNYEGDQPPESLIKGLNSILSPDIRILEFAEVDVGFHARRDAKGKWYRYLIEPARYPHPLAKNISVNVEPPIDLDAMRKAASCFVGAHDFTSFRAAGSSAKTSERTITELSIEKTGINVGGVDMVQVIAIDVRGTGFLYKMVRNIVGVLIEVGKGRTDPGEVQNIIDARDRSAASVTAPAKGLTMMAVYY